MHERRQPGVVESGLEPRPAAVTVSSTSDRSSTRADIGSVHLDYVVDGPGPSDACARTPARRLRARRLLDDAAWGVRDLMTFPPALRLNAAPKSARY